LKTFALSTLVPASMATLALSQESRIGGPPGLLARGEALRVPYADAASSSKSYTGNDPMNTDSRALVEALNRMLAQEHACAIRYATHAATVSGPSAEAIAARLLEISADEIAHARKLRKRILALGGVPTMDVSREDLKASPTLKGILDINVLEERGAVEQYRKILESIPRLDVLLYETVEEILRDEQEHLEELQNLFVQS